MKFSNDEIIQMKTKRKIVMVQEGPSIVFLIEIMFQEVPIYWASKNFKIIQIV